MGYVDYYTNTVEDAAAFERYHGDHDYDRDEDRYDGPRRGRTFPAVDCEDFQPRGAERTTDDSDLPF